MAAMIVVMVLMMAGPYHGYGYVAAPPQADASYVQVEKIPPIRDSNP
jgi:hypothetical protein